MLKWYAYVFTSPAVCYSTYLRNTDGNACVICVWYGVFLFQLGAFRIKNFSRTCVYSGMVYDFPVLYSNKHFCFIVLLCSCTIYVNLWMAKSQGRVFFEDLWIKVTCCIELWMFLFKQRVQVLHIQSLT
jgi:hypothetical protein